MDSETSVPRRRFRGTNLGVIIVLIAAAILLAVLAARVVHTVLLPEPARQNLSDAGSDPGLTGQAAEADRQRRVRQGQGSNQENYSVQNKVSEGQTPAERAPAEPRQDARH